MALQLAPVQQQQQQPPAPDLAVQTRRRTFRFSFEINLDMESSVAGTLLRYLQLFIMAIYSTFGLAISVVTRSRKPLAVQTTPPDVPTGLSSTPTSPSGSPILARVARPKALRLDSSLLPELTHSISSSDDDGAPTPASLSRTTSQTSSNPAVAVTKKQRLTSLVRWPSRRASRAPSSSSTSPSREPTPVEEEIEMLPVRTPKPSLVKRFSHRISLHRSQTTISPLTVSSADSARPGSPDSDISISFSVRQERRVASEQVLTGEYGLVEEPVSVSAPTPALPSVPATPKQNAFDKVFRVGSPVNMLRRSVSEADPRESLPATKPSPKQPRNRHEISAALREQRLREERHARRREERRRSQQESARSASPAAGGISPECQSSLPSPA